MRVKFLTSVSTVISSHSSGSTEEINDVQARQWIDCEYCVAVEQAVVAPKKRGKRKVVEEDLL